MLKSLREFFDQRIAARTDKPQRAEEQELQLAAAALLIEMTRADRTVSDDEQRVVDEALREVFALDETQTRDLVYLAEQELGGSASLFEFTHLIDKSFDVERKIQVIEMLWRVAYADSCKSHHEEHLVRKIADLLHVPHTAFIQARLRVEQGLAR
ncbi:MAG: TerB family tellurite resistance protein [Chromatiales bacterium]|jgi:uncharacterized tellurite resistance protein B-like protein|nr:TerB family tellurite resistance protein [Chromatiales bacterium]